MKAQNQYFLRMDRDLRARQRVLVGGFLINSALVTASALAALVLNAGPAMAARLGGDVADADTWVARGLIAWAAGGVLIFLVPALATYWARAAGGGEKGMQYFTGKGQKSRI